MATLADALREILQKALPQPQNMGVGPTLANQVAPAQAAQPQQQVAQQLPAQAPPALPTMPNFGQPNSGGGGFKGFLKDTLSEIIPAATQVAIWGPGEFGQRMAYNKLVTHLGKKKDDEEKEKQNFIAQMGTAHAGMRKYLRENGGDPDMYYYALSGGGSTGNPQVDSWIQQFRTEIEPLVKSGKIGASDMLTSFEKVKPFEDLTKEEGLKSEKVVAQEESIFKRKQQIEAEYKKRESRSIEQLTEDSLKGDAEATAILKKMQQDKMDVAHGSREPAKPDKPNEPRRKIEYFDKQGESHFLPDNAEVPAGYTRVVPTKRKSGSPKSAEEFLSKYK